MSLQGSLRDFTVSEILQMLGTQRKTGCILLTRDSENVVVYLSEGRVVAARDPGMRADDPLLAFLRNIHRLSEEQYRGLVTIHRETGRDLEDLLLNGRYMDRAELSQYVERQILDTLLRLSEWDQGSYRFDPAAVWKGERLVSLSIEGTLIEAARRVDECKRFRSRLGDPHQVLGVSDLPDPQEPLTDEERELFGILDGRRTLAEVTQAAPLTEYEALEALDRMMEAGWVERVARRDPGHAVPEPPPTPVAAQRHPVGREMVVAAAALALVTVLLASGQMLTRAAPAENAVSDVFVADQLRELRKVLDLYRRETGHYPERLEQLVEDRWLSPRQIRVPGHHVRYRRITAGADYRLQLDRER